MCTSAVFACNGWIPRVHITPTKRTHETAVRFHAKMPECPLCLYIDGDGDTPYDSPLHLAVNELFEAR